MGSVKYEEIIYPYFKIGLQDEQADDVGIKLKKIFEYIDNYKNMGGIWPYGNAYKAIRKKAKIISGRNNVRFSKREVKALINHFKHNGSTERYIKIPYKLDCIFKAIFELVDELKEQYPLPSDIQGYIGQIRRNCFYELQSELFYDFFNAKQENQTTLNKHLLDDMFSADCTLNQKF